VPRRAQLALALILLLVFAPLGGASCGIECMAAIPLHTIHSVTTQHPCVRASACCHPNGAVICSATQAPDAAVALFAADNSIARDPSMVAVIAAASPSLRSHAGAAHGIDSSPPGQPRFANPVPLRV
jgi:hypothetical protein